MAILQISQIQVRRGLKEDLPQLASGELGWSIDSRQLYIGNGTRSEGAPTEGTTEILTEHSVLNFTYSIQSNVTNLTSNVSSLSGDVNTINNQILSLQSGQFNSNIITLPGSSSGTITTFRGTNAAVYYTLTQTGKQRSGIISFTRNGTDIAYDDEFRETGTTDVVLSISGNSTSAQLDYNTTSVTVFSWQTRTV
jgi:Major tropism determinant N-terminal domain